MLQYFPPCFCIRIWTLISFLLLIPIALDKVFDPTEYEFHKDRLRTGPATPNTTIYCSKQHNTDHNDQHPEKEDVHILRQENIPKDGEFSFYDVKHQERISIYLDKWSCKKKQQQRVTNNLSIIIKLPGRLLSINPLSFRFFWLVSILIPLCCYFHGIVLFNLISCCCSAICCCCRFSCSAFCLVACYFNTLGCFWIRRFGITQCDDVVTYLSNLCWS